MDELDSGGFVSEELMHVKDAMLVSDGVCKGVG